jgi:hypothetical protein
VLRVFASPVLHDQQPLSEGSQPRCSNEATLHKPLSLKNARESPGAVSGTVYVAGNAAAVRASYEWEWSGLPASTVVQFAFRAVTKTGAGDGSQVISLLVK